ncbi:MAG: MoaD/ThiS family protein [Chloroflexi bacterium]|nr:MoaD/ThiS family protein [Chloroflexota bacterium]
MAVTVRLPQLLAQRAGSQVVALPESDSLATLGDVLTQLCLGHPELRSHLYDEDGQVDIHYLLFINGQHVSSEDMARTPVEEGAQVDILMPLAGGYIQSLGEGDET